MTAVKTSRKMVEDLTENIIPTMERDSAKAGEERGEISTKVKALELEIVKSRNKLKADITEIKAGAGNLKNFKQEFQKLRKRVKIG